jgi:hypothetical protein
MFMPANQGLVQQEHLVEAHSNCQPLLLLLLSLLLQCLLLLLLLFLEHLHKGMNSIKHQHKQAVQSSTSSNCRTVQIL